MVLREKSKWTEIFLKKKKMNKFVLKIWINRRASYFIGILSEIRDVFLHSYPQVFFPLNLR